MKTKEEIINILIDGLENIYCLNCRGKELDEYSEGFNCDWCHRNEKGMLVLDTSCVGQLFRELFVKCNDEVEIILLEGQLNKVIEVIADERFDELEEEN